MVRFITLTNTGYLNYTLNCLESLKKINSKYLPFCYCIGKEGFDKLSSAGYECSLINEGEKHSNFQTFRNGNWSNITFNKFKIIYENLLVDDYVCITDGDIVYENNIFMDYLLENIGDHDILIQNERMTNEESLNEESLYVCSGFMFIKSNEKTLKLFNPEMMKKNNNTLGWDDQVYVNQIIKELKYKVLPLELFPNGQYYYKYHANITPYIIHFNWCIGHNKKNNMKKYNKWLLNA